MDRRRPRDLARWPRLRAGRRPAARRARRQRSAGGQSGPSPPFGPHRRAAAATRRRAAATARPLPPCRLRRARHRRGMGQGADPAVPKRNRPRAVGLARARRDPNDPRRPRRAAGDPDDRGLPTHRRRAQRPTPGAPPQRRGHGRDARASPHGAPARSTSPAGDTGAAHDAPTTRRRRRPWSTARIACCGEQHQRRWSFGHRPDLVAKTHRKPQETIGITHRPQRPPAIRNRLQTS